MMKISIGSCTRAAHARSTTPSCPCLLRTPSSCPAFCTQVHQRGRRRPTLQWGRQTAHDNRGARGIFASSSSGTDNKPVSSMGDTAVRVGFSSSADHEVLNRIVLSTQLRGTYLLGLNCCKASQLENHIQDLQLDEIEVVLAMMASASPQLSGLKTEDLLQVACEFLGTNVADVASADSRAADFYAELADAVASRAAAEAEANKDKLGQTLVDCMARILLALHTAGAPVPPPSVGALRGKPWWPDVLSALAELQADSKVQMEGWFAQ